MTRFGAISRLASIGLLFCFAAEAADTAQDPVTPAQAIWKPQEINFTFVSYTASYSCTSLRDKLKRILKELGVRGEVRVSAAGCDAGAVKLPFVKLSVFAPVEATPEALAEQEKARSTRELAARYKGKEAQAQYAEETAQFPAQWKRVSLSRGRLGLEPGDCELIDELKKKVLPKLSVRIIRDEVRCTPYQNTLGQPRLEVESLAELPKADEAKKDAPAKENAPEKDAPEKEAPEKEANER